MKVETTVPFLTLQTLQGSELEAVLSGVDDPQITSPSTPVLGIADSPYVVNGAMQLDGRNPLCYWQNKPRDRGKQSFYSCPCPVPSWTRLGKPRIRPCSKQNLTSIKLVPSLP